MRVDPVDGRIFDDDRPEHTRRRPTYSVHIGKAAFTPHLRQSANGNDWCKFILIERGTRFDGPAGPKQARNWMRKWAVYAFGEMARYACDSIRVGDRIIVYGFERGINRYTDSRGVEQELYDITAWDLGQSMKVNHAFSERNGVGKVSRNRVRAETGRPLLVRYTDEEGPPPEDY